MNIVTRFATLATLIVAATAVAEESNSDNDRLLLARAELAGASVAVDSVALDEYVGRYLADSGVDFVVVHEDGALVIELPETWGVLEAKLVAEGAGDFVAAEVAVRVSFERDSDGRVTGLLAYPRGEAPIAAVKMPLLRGVVTIEDVNTDAIAEAAIAHTMRRGIVTIEDVYDAPGVLSVAAAQ
jgi:hypothetical protein